MGIGDHTCYSSTILILNFRQAKDHLRKAMKYAPRHVANALLWKAKKEGASLTHLKLQKLIFFLHAWGLALKGKPVVDENFEAWPYGPVLSSLYHELKNFGSKPISNYLVEIDPSNGKQVAKVPKQDELDFWGLVDQVWDRYGKMSAAQLSTLSHEPGGPWENARSDMDNSFSSIPDEAIREFYTSKLSRAV